ncbi:MAG: hypothetical protein V9F00_16880 [Nocardioides sp.]
MLRLILELRGRDRHRGIRAGIGYLHTGIEKNMEYRSWTQGTTFVHPDGLPRPVLQRGRLLSWRVERLLGIEDDIPEQAQRHPGAADGAQPDLLPPGRASAPAAWRSAR